MGMMRLRRWARVLGVSVLCAAGCVRSGVAAEETSPDAGRGRFDPAIPSPESVLGHRVGDGAVRYDALTAYLHALAESSPRVTLTEYARSHEGRRLYYLTITSEANHQRLEAIKASNAKLADPRTLGGGDETDRIVNDLPAVAWLGYNIHGDELSSTDAAVQVAFELAAATNDATRRLRDELVILIDPLMNPDGRERYLAQLETLEGKIPNPDYQAMQHAGLWSAGRGNHYLFDLNRDWLPQVHPETRGRVRVHLEWHPHLVVDSHEMGALSTYLFSPPREPINIHQSEKVLAWRTRFARDQARAFDEHGWSYYTGEWNEEWYVGYTNAWASLLGSVGLLYEQAGMDGTLVRQPAGQALTYAEAVRHHVVSTIANLTTLRENRRAVLADYAADRRWAVTADGPFGETFLLPPAADRARAMRFVELLGRHGIEMETAASAFEAAGVVNLRGEREQAKTLPAGKVLVRSKQPHRRLIHAILEFDPRMTEEALREERKEVERRRGSQIYDITAWNLPMAYGLEAYWADGVLEVESREGSPASAPAASTVGPARYGYLIDGASDDVYRMLVRLFDAGCKPRVGIKPFMLERRAYAPGAIVLRRHEHEADLAAKAASAAEGLAVDVKAVDTAWTEEGPDLGGERFELLQPPRVAIASQWPVSPTSFGAVWHALDARLGMRVSPINLQSFGGVDLRKYNVLILPDVSGAERLGAVLGDAEVKSLKAWIEAGGTLIAIGDAARFGVGKERGLSAVRLRRDVLDQLDVYAEAVRREREAKTISIDAHDVWGSATRPATQPTTAPAATTAPADGEKDLEQRKRLDEWQRIFGPQGAMAAAELDAEHWLCFGLGEMLPVLVSGDACYLSKHPVETAARLGPVDALRLSGLIWPEARERLADSAYATRESVGNGQVILFAGEPTFRGYFEGSTRMMLNAVLLGPGMGTSTPVPW